MWNMRSPRWSKEVLGNKRFRLHPNPSRWIAVGECHLCKNSALFPSERLAISILWKKTYIACVLKMNRQLIQMKNCIIRWWNMADWEPREVSFRRLHKRKEEENKALTFLSTRRLVGIVNKMKVSERGESFGFCGCLGQISVDYC